MKGLYVHIPFCVNKCGYCGFYSEAGSGELTQKYFDCLIRDFQLLNEKNYDTLYIGGGTPSHVPPFLLATFLEKISDIPFRESTIEANPESVSDDFLSVVGDFGFTRLSMGCQSTDDGVLRLLGRAHTSSDVFRAYDLARKKCPDADINLDMIYDIPSAENSKAEKTLGDIVSLSPEHVSAYSYSFDTGYLADEKQHEDSLYLTVKHRLQNAGYHKYEISNFARPGHESLHNINYWMMGDYDGIGASAWSMKSCDGRRVLRGKASDMGGYTDSPESFASEEVTSGIQLLYEDVVFGLRMLDGVDISGLNIKYDKDVRSVMKEPLKHLEKEGLVIWNLEKLRLTEKGELLLDSVQEYLWGFLP
ncbi:MAG: coproporphyrinogen-III oxidase family protein [Deferribacterales bacterium]